MNPNWPTEVKVGSVQWQLVFDAKSTVENSQYGTTSDTTIRIVLDPSLPPTKLREVFIHELLHAVQDSFMPPKARIPEAQIKPLAAGLAAALADNPWIAALFGGGRHE